VLWGVTLYNPVEIYRLLDDLGKVLPNYTTSHTIKTIFIPLIGGGEKKERN